MSMRFDSENAFTNWLEEAYSREATGSYEDCKLEPLALAIEACGLKKGSPCNTCRNQRERLNSRSP